MDVKMLPLGKDTYPVAYGMNCLGEICEDLGVDFFGAGFKMGIKGTIVAIHRGIQEGCMRQGIKFNLTRREVGGILEDNFEQAPAFTTLFYGSIAEVSGKIIAAEEKLPPEETKS